MNIKSRPLQQENCCCGSVQKQVNGISCSVAHAAYKCEKCSGCESECISDIVRMSRNYDYDSIALLHLCKSFIFISSKKSTLKCNSVYARRLPNPIVDSSTLDAYRLCYVTVRLAVTTIPKFKSTIVHSLKFSTQSKQ